MKIRDYWRLGAANITAHRKRVVKVVAIVGVLFGVVMMAAMLIAGIEKTVLAEMSWATDGKILVGTRMDMEYCGEACEWEVEAEKIRENVRQSGGEVLDSKAYELNGGRMVTIPERILTDEIKGRLKELPEDAVPVLVSMGTAMQWLKIEVPRWARPEQAVKLIEEAEEKALGKVIELENGQRVYVAGITTDSVARFSLTLSGVGQELNPLNLILGVVPLTGSNDFLIDAGDGRIEKWLAEAKPEETEWPEGMVETFPELAKDSGGEVLALFPNLAMAEAYRRRPENDCDWDKKTFGQCAEEYKYTVATELNDPLEVAKVFRTVWTVFDVVATVLAGIAAIVMLTTYLRLVGQDTKVIALYRANGATKRQVMGIYTMYLIMLSLLAISFAILLAVILTLVVNWLNAGALTEAFTLAMGVVGQKIVLIGGNKWIMLAGVIMLVIAPVVVLCGVRQFSGKNLAKKLK